MSSNITQEKTAQEYLQSLTLLCVEDNKTTQVLYESILEDLVKEIIFADDGEEGYEKFSNNSVDIIVSDFDMPKVNGIGMIEQIRELDKEIPIILASAIEDVEIFKASLHLGVNYFVPKPIEKKELCYFLDKSSQILLDRCYIKEQKSKELLELQNRDKYSKYQEDLAFQKELNILRNDFYYQLISAEHISLVDFLYQPLDVISGDAYTARRIDENRTFYLIVDGMGKGLSASLTAMLMTSFISHLIDKMKEYDSFSFNILIKESLEYIQPILLDEEAVAVDYILFDTAYDTLSYAKFAMPASLMQDKEHNIIRLKSNNPPLCKYASGFKIDEYNVKNIDKFLFYSDGIVENITSDNVTTYADYIEEDFEHSFTREDLKSKFFSKIETPEDDITLIFINRLAMENAQNHEREFVTSLSEIDSANEWYSELFKGFTTETSISYAAELVFTELYMNAYEHGNLGITSSQKHRLIENDTYFETLQEKETHCDKKIHVKVSKLTYKFSTYVITQISDEGEGFDTQILSEIFRNGAKFNGRGVFVSRKNSLGIYYNSKGTSVLYLNKI